MLRGEVYVVRIYYREGRPERTTRGIVEVVKARRFIAFSDFEMLRDILSKQNPRLRKKAVRKTAR
jgi:hypothetical protein